MLAAVLLSPVRAVDRAGAWWTALAIRDLAGEAVAAPAPHMVVMFLDPECPVANGYVPVMNALAAEFTPKGFAFLGAYADPAAKTAQLRDHAREFRIGFTVVDDRAQSLARHVSATYSAEVAVLGRAGEVLYRGRIDDRVGANGASRPAATRHDLRDVLRRLSAGEHGPFPSEPGFGCALAAPVKKP